MGYEARGCRLGRRWDMSMGLLHVVDKASFTFKHDWEELVMTRIMNHFTWYKDNIKCY